MRILHAYTHHRGGGGAENFIRSTIELCRQHGLAVESFCCNSNELGGGIRAHLEAGMRAFYSPPTVRLFEEAVERFGPDVVHLHDLFPLIPPQILGVCRRRKIPVVMSAEHYRLTCPIATHFRDGKVCTQCTGGREHWAVLHNCRGSVPESAIVAVYNKLESQFRVFTGQVDHFIAPSNFAREWLMQHLPITEERITTIEPFPEVPDEPADAGTGSYVGFAGRFVPEKGIDVVIEAARETGIPFHLSRHESYLVRVDLPPSAEVVVTRTRDDLRQFFRGARMMVFPSIWFETFGLSGAEAMSHGIPLVASRIGALAELVRDGVDGLLFEPGNARDLAAKVRLLWEDPELSRRLGRAARERVVRHWHPEVHIQRLRGLYEQVAYGRAERQAVAT
ncbi:MAG: glycosyltransferase family 4 protein [Bryobacteraceae bacterium]|nr:glycosyltransferase family 4 protein [Bryobacteraceae bacterium]